MQFQVILTSIALSAGLMLPHASLAAAKARPKTPANAAILDMSEAYKKLDRKRLAALLPQVKGHVLEPWGAYWELSARLDDASATEVQAFLTRYAGTYQEDRLRNEWLLRLGKRRDWATFLAEHAKFRMNDDLDVLCYGLLANSSVNGAEIAAQVQGLWLSQHEPDEGCAGAADQLLKA
jgi:soluble lytic murein transglycosylase